MSWENMAYLMTGFVVGGVVAILLWFLAYRQAWGRYK